MSEEIELDYEYLTQRALRRVVFDALSLTAEMGRAPGRHHFYIEFETHGDGVDIPQDLKSTYPERMTIVLQHQFDDLKVDEGGFAVTLRFKGKPSRLIVPFDAVTSFADPGAKFGLRFDSAMDGDDHDDAEPAGRPDTPAPELAEKSNGAEVVSLDKFRKK